MNFHLWNIPLGIIAFIVAYSAINVRSVRKHSIKEKGLWRGWLTVNDPDYTRDQSTARPSARRQRMTHRKDTPMSDPTKIHVHTSDDGPCGYCSGVDCPMRYCPGCPPGCALAEDEPDSTSDVRSVSPARGPECPESVAGDGPGVTQSPSGYPSDPPPLKGPQNRVERISDAEAAELARLAAEATEGPWVVDQDGSIGAPMAGLVCGEAGHPRPDCSECGTRVCHTSVMPGEPDAAFIAAARTAVPRLLADRERLTGEASRVPVLLADKAALMGDVDRLTAERDGARGMRVIATRAFETTRRVLQEASGLPDDIDDPDCRDEMVLALRPRAEKAEAEVARLREGIEALSDEMQSDTCPACHASYADDGSTTWGCDHTEGMQHAGDLLRALLAEGGE